MEPITLPLRFSALKRGSAIRRLFDSPDPRETKKMVEDMVETEAERLKMVWDFDVRWLNSPELMSDEAAEQHVNVSMSKRRRFAWVKQSAQDTPSFYTRPIHRNYSETRNFQQNWDQENRPHRGSKQVKNHLPIFSERGNKAGRNDSCPLKARNFGRCPALSSPPRPTELSQKELNFYNCGTPPSIRVSTSPFFDPTPSSVFANQSKHSAKKEQSPVQPSESSSTMTPNQPSDNRCYKDADANTPTSRQLFRAISLEKRKTTPGSIHQRKITGKSRTKLCA